MHRTSDENPMRETPDRLSFATNPEVEYLPPQMPQPNATFSERLRKMPWPVTVAVTYDLVINVGFHIVAVLVLYDLRKLNYSGNGSLILDAATFDSKAHFWTLYGFSVNLNLNTTSVLLWGLLISAIGKGDPSWVKAWIMMKKMVIFLMVPHNAAVAFGGETKFATFHCITFFFYFLLSVLMVELVTRYYIPLEVKSSAQTSLLTM